MSRLLRALLVEDSESDAAITARLLERAGNEVRWRRVESAEELRAALAGEAWDVVISDYRMPRFDAPAALAILQQTGLDIPFIVVSGTIGEEIAVAMMKAGAQDYLTKGHLARLAPAVARELADASSRRDQRQSVREREALHASLEKMANEWRITFDTLEIPVLIIGPDGHILRMNRAARDLTGRGFRDNIGHSLPGETCAFPWPHTLTLVLQAVTGKGIASAQLKHDASGRIWDCTASWFRNPGSLESSVVLTAREITGMVKLQETLRRGETMSAMGAIVSGVAHEVRNPLFGIVATLDAFTANHGDKPEFREYIEILRGETHRLSMLMEDLLDYGHPPSLAITRGPAAGLFTWAVEAMQPLAFKQGARIETRAVPDLPELEFDPRRMGQVFFNLLDNAIRHSPPGSAVTLRAAFSADRHSLMCSVLDEGPGIKPEDLPHLFEPFFTRRAGGTGLGLAIVQRIVEQHGGQLTAANRPEGGAVFTVTLQLVGPGNPS